VITIHKGAAPRGLIRAGEKHAGELCADYDADPDMFRSGEKTMEVRDRIYASKSVKSELEECQHGKCGYCEAVIPKPYAYSHVDHWRPKSSSRQELDDERVRPGYYWLAYTWDNLVLSCLFCNSNKNDLFPLDDPAQRARHHGMPIDDETPGILKPDGDRDPREHITFHEEVPVGLTPLGRTTIAVLGLAKEAHEPRRTHLNKIRKKREMYLKLMNSVDPTARHYAELARTAVLQATRPEEPYSAMIAAYLESNPLPDPPA
jgi:5-methylcytosine-specific restriction endonuclease McrA